MRLERLELIDRAAANGDERDDAVHHTYSSYGRGGDVLWGMYQWLDRAPLGRNETPADWCRVRDEYDE